MTPAQARSIIRGALALCALVALVVFVAMVLTWSALAAKADDDDDCKTVTLARLNNYGPYPACEQPSELRLHYLIRAHNYATWLHEREKTCKRGDATIIAAEAVARFRHEVRVPYRAVIGDVSGSRPNSRNFDLHPGPYILQ
jgi:hypothetical protein